MKVAYVNNVQWWMASEKLLKKIKEMWGNLCRLIHLFIAHAIQSLNFVVCRDGKINNLFAKEKHNFHTLFSKSKLFSAREIFLGKAINWRYHEVINNFAETSASKIVCTMFFHSFQTKDKTNTWLVNIRDLKHCFFLFWLKNSYISLYQIRH